MKAGETREIEIDKIKLNPDWPYRKEMGYLDGLMKSMDGPDGLLQAIGVNTKLEIVWGFRRFNAAKQKGWKTILARVVDLKNPLAAMKAENEDRKPFTASEMVAMMRSIEVEERKKAQGRKAHGGTGPGRNASGNISRSVPGNATDHAAAAFGLSGKTFEAMKKVDANATEEVKEVWNEGSVSHWDAASVAKEPAAVQKAAAKSVKAGESKTLREGARKAKKKNGQPFYDDRKIQGLIGKLARSIDDRGEAYGKSKEYDDCLDKLDKLLSAWNRWQIKEARS
jgi:hypothetical protein